VDWVKKKGQGNPGKKSLSTEQTSRDSAEGLGHHARDGWGGGFMVRLWKRKKKKMFSLGFGKGGRPGLSRGITPVPPGLSFRHLRGKKTWGKATSAKVRGGGTWFGRAPPGVEGEFCFEKKIQARARGTERAPVHSAGAASRVAA